jgi:hypothetical protein
MPFSGSVGVGVAGSVSKEVEGKFPTGKESSVGKGFLFKSKNNIIKKTNIKNGKTSHGRPFCFLGKKL